MAKAVSKLILLISTPQNCTTTNNSQQTGDLNYQKLLPGWFDSEIWHCGSSVLMVKQLFPDQDMHSIDCLHCTVTVIYIICESQNGLYG